MNKVELNQLVKTELENKRIQAKTLHILNKMQALENEDFLNAENRIGELTIEIAKKELNNQDTSKEYNEIKELNSKKTMILKTLKMTPNDIDNIYYCTKCKDTGIFEGKKCECVTSIFTNILKTQSGTVIDDISFEDCSLVDSKYVSILKKFCESYDNEDFQYLTLLLSGPTGVGKSCLTTAMANYYLKEKSLYTIFTTSININSDFINYHREYTINKQKYLEPYLNADVLIVDDLGTEPMVNNITKEYFYLLISERLANKKLTIFTTNLSPDGVKERYSERFFSRAFSQTTGLTIKITGEDLRLKKQV